MAEALSLFEWQPGRRVQPAARPSSTVSGLVLRPYQQDAVEAVFRCLAVRRCALAVLATGLGKTTIFGEVARLWPGRVLIVAHRDELLEQARNRMRQMTRGFVGLDQAKSYSMNERVVVASIQTLARPSRLARYKDDPPALVVIDEAHHATADSYRTVLDAFPEARVLGVTATPDRADGSSLEEVFGPNSGAYRREIGDGIDDGYLVPFVGKSLRLEHADLTMVGTVAGDFNLGQLDAEMIKENEHVAQQTLAFAGERKTIVFSTKVSTAWDLVEHFNKEAGRRVAVAVDGEMDVDERRRRLREHSDPASSVSILVNVGIATEGYDSPLVSCVAIARPTKSRALYTQMAGRGGRVLPGLVEGEPDADARRALIAASGKPNCLLLDFSPTAGKHKLVGPADILGGSRGLDEAVSACARELMANSTIDVREAIRLAAELAETERRMRASVIRQVRADVRSDVRDVDLFGAGNQEFPTGPAPVRFADHRQVQMLVRKFGWHEPEARQLTMREAGQQIRTEFGRRKHGLATRRQLQTLQHYGIPDVQSMSIPQASAVIGALKAQGGRALAPSEIHQLVANATAHKEG